MRDVLVMAIVIVGALAALRRPWIGVLLWTWLSLMNPHRYTYGFAYDAPVAAIAAGCTFVGLVFTRERDSPFKGPPVVLFALFCAWVTLSWLMGLDRSSDTEQWTKVMKINLMIFVALSLLRTKEHIFGLVWVSALSLALLGAKGGVFTILTGGAHRVWGPAGSFIEDNNEFALALVITIPLLRFLQLQLTNKSARHLMTVVMVLCAAAALGSHSRGGLLAILAMSFFLWWRGRSRFLGGIVILVTGVLLISFMPEEWTTRMETINEFSEDNSAVGRFSAWWTAWNLAFHYPFGVGFYAARPELFVLYSPYGLEYGTPAAHSIYFQVLGNHGFVGLALYLAILLATYRACSQIRKDAAEVPEARWCGDLASLAQVSLIGFSVGGAFLSLSYFDQTYNIMAIVVLTRVWLQRRAWETEPAPLEGKWRLPGLSSAPGIGNA